MIERHHCIHRLINHVYYQRTKHPLLFICPHDSLVALPASVDTLVWYAQHLSSKLKAHSTLRCYLSGVKKLHQVLGLPPESFNSYILQMTLMGLCRDNQLMVKQALAMTPEWLEKMIPFLDFNTEMDTLFWTACLVAFFLLFRKSNLLPESQLAFNTLQQLKRNDLIFTGQHIIVGIRWAKTHQFSRELLTFPLPLIRGHPLCPVTAINRVFKQIKRGSRDHLFSFSNGTSLTYPAFQSKLRGVFGGGWSPHSYGIFQPLLPQRWLFLWVPLWGSSSPFKVTWKLAK